MGKKNALIARAVIVLIGLILFNSGSNVKSFVIRCGTPDCDWGKKMCDLGEEQLRLCYSEFRKHCVHRHDLQEWDATPQAHLDLENWSLTLIKT